MLKASVFWLLCRVSKIGHKIVHFFTCRTRWCHDGFGMIQQPPLAATTTPTGRDASKILDNLGRWWLPLVAYSRKSIVYAELCRHVSGCREILTSKCICRSYSIHIGWFWSFFWANLGKNLGFPHQGGLQLLDCGSLHLDALGLHGRSCGGGCVSLSHLGCGWVLRSWDEFMLKIPSGKR